MTDNAQVSPGDFGADPRLDPDLMENGDTRNVVDKYRFWSVEAIKADLDESRAALHIAIENLDARSNIGSIVRTGNAFTTSVEFISLAGAGGTGAGRW